MCVTPFLNVNRHNFIKRSVQVYYPTHILQDKNSFSQMFFKIGVLKNLKNLKNFSKQVFLNIHRKIPVLESFFNKVGSLESCNLLKKRLQHRCFLVNIAKFLRTTISIKHLRWLLPKGATRTFPLKFGRTVKVT